MFDGREVNLKVMTSKPFCRHFPQESSSRLASREIIYELHRWIQQADKMDDLYM